MSFFDDDVDKIIESLKSDVEPVVIHTKYDVGSYSIQKTVLGCVSNKLAERCDRKHIYLLVEDDGFRIFLIWLLCRTVGHLVINEQKSLAVAWNFGMQYDIPEFQNAVMQELVRTLRSETVSLDAVLVAYEHKSSTLLQAAIVGQLAIDMRDQHGHHWPRKDLADLRIRRLVGFSEDLIEAMAKAKDGPVSIQVEDYLVEVVDP